MLQADIKRALHSAISSCLPMGPDLVSTRPVTRDEWFEVEIWMRKAARPASTLVIRMSREAQDDLRENDRKTHDELCEQIERYIASDVDHWLSAIERGDAAPRLVVISSDAVG